MPHSKGFAKRKDERSAEPVPVGDVIRALLNEEAFSRGIPIGTLADRWPDVVGPKLAEATQPVSLESGVLVVRAADGPWGAQARYLTEQIRRRADEALGGGAVRSVRVVVQDLRNRR